MTTQTSNHFIVIIVHTHLSTYWYGRPHGDEYPLLLVMLPDLLIATVWGIETGLQVYLDSFAGYWRWQPALLVQCL